MKFRTILLLLLAIFPFISQNTYAQGWDWARNSHCGGDDNARSIVSDKGGNVYITGVFHGTTMTVGAFTLTNTGPTNTSDVFLIKYDTSGNVVWAKNYGGALWDFCYCLSIDTADNLYLAGFFQSTSISFGALTIANPGSNSEMFLVKIDTAGTAIWAKQSGFASNDLEITSVATDTFGGVYVVGFFGSSTLKFGTTTMANSGSFPTNDLFIVKYRSDGSYVWVKGAGGTSDDIPECINTDKSGNFFITGYFMSPSIIFGTTTLVNAGSYDAFIAKYDSLGNPIWAKNTGVSAMGYSVATDNSQNVYVAGVFSGPSISFGTTTLTNAGTTGNDAFCVKYDPFGSVIWANSIGGTASEFAGCVHINDAGFVYMSGYFFSPSMVVGTTTLTNNSSANLYFVKYDSTGVFQYAASADSGTASGASITTDRFNNVYLSGNISGVATIFGTDTLINGASPSNSDFFVAKYHEIPPVLPTTQISNAGTSDIVIYPNPVSDKLIVEAPMKYRGNAISIVNIIGQLVAQETIETGTNVFDLHTQPAGIYIVKIASCGTNMYKKVIKN